MNVMEARAWQQSGGWGSAEIHRTAGFLDHSASPTRERLTRHRATFANPDGLATPARPPRRSRPVLHGLDGEAPCWTPTTQRQTGWSAWVGRWSDTSGPNPLRVTRRQIGSRVYRWAYEEGSPRDPRRLVRRPRLDLASASPERGRESRAVGS